MTQKEEIPSAIYGDPTLGANLKFVILRMIFYEGTSLPQIVEDNATVSLENVNEWNHGIWNALPRDERHDVAVWLTRLNIGFVEKCVTNKQTILTQEAHLGTPRCLVLAILRGLAA